MKRFIMIMLLMTCASGYAWADDCYDPKTGKPFTCSGSMIDGG
jgi:hypothetical protein